MSGALIQPDRALAPLVHAAGDICQRGGHSRSSARATRATVLRRHLRGAFRRDGGKVWRTGGASHHRERKRPPARQHIRQVPQRGGRREGLPRPEQPLVQWQAHIRRALARHGLPGRVVSIPHERLSSRRLLQLPPSQADIALASTQTLQEH